MKEAMTEKRVLVVDDEPMIVDIMTRTLSFVGYNCLSASNGEDAVILFKNMHDRGIVFDLVILDLFMSPGIGGIETLAEIRKINPHIKAICCSGTGELSTADSFGFVGSISKPFEIRQFMSEIGKVIA